MSVYEIGVIVGDGVSGSPLLANRSQPSGALQRAGCNAVVSAKTFAVSDAFDAVFCQSHALVLAEFFQHARDMCRLLQGRLTLHMIG